MFEGEMRIEIERRVIAALDERAGKGLPAVSLDSLRAIVRADLTRELEAKRQASARPAAPPVPKANPRPLPPAPRPAPVLPAKRPFPVTPPKAAAPAPHPIVLAERARAQAILAMTPKGAEAEGTKAIRLGMSVAEYEGSIAAWAILDSRRRAEGRS